MIIIKSLIMLILCSVFPFCLFTWILTMIWMFTPFTPLKRLCHDVLGWHKPSGKYKHKKEGIHSNCMICGCDIVSDGADGWKKI